MLCLQGVSAALLFGRPALILFSTLLLLPAATRWPAIAMGLDGVMIYAGALGALLAVFARSLRKGREPIVSLFARRVHGPLRPDVARYTRRLTIFWSLFFVLALGAPLLLSVLGPAGAWRWPLQGGTFGAVVILMIAEAGLRRLIIRNFEHVSLRTTVAAFRGTYTRPRS
ncbi:COG4648 family protein [Brytella acorum]|uniref:Uncharacterized protein n=1 Tax=Brytella acorum TaxID=2959299 RepID=A0AA35Y1W3_9PROT|nr:hypothetical protein [Brytella acorum]MDF3625127.1 hypothetical protein [Brytella acorum]CAI9120993.1 hypothetical protein LMG32879_001837 [Brytella acorum]